MAALLKFALTLTFWTFSATACIFQYGARHEVVRSQRQHMKTAMFIHGVEALSHVV
jgi:hypothetical protein